ncbi:hypothetical protein IE81DRAFT_201302 [Ceraceosorus guamensis]|uniref:Uncharacterized protein n=1 Tax=Ceraceosorus guamensis TaxID=1522189 RepID=A0A316VWL5_9BASI|nr:hypothetical protein IE81DRAFT_201302 [Ceraceosorus guamensis]PWN40833.1 hypothetical protein IE81DRAFT_201302 [Ceraceosorus guamensis]
MRLTSRAIVLNFALALTLLTLTSSAHSIDTFAQDVHLIPKGRSQSPARSQPRS